MSGSGGRFKFLKKFSSKIDKLFLGDMIQSNKSDSKKDYENSQPSDSSKRFNKFNDSIDSDYNHYYGSSSFSEDNNYKNYNNYGNPINRNYEYEKNNLNFEDKYADYIYPKDVDDSCFSEGYVYPERGDSRFQNDFRYDNFSNGAVDYVKDNYQESSENSFKEDKSSLFNLKNLKNKLLNSDESSKKNFGLIAFCLIILVLGASVFYFGIFQPFQNELNTEKTAKLNELNTLYKGPLALNSHVFTLENQIEDSYNINEIRSIDVLRTATDDWRKYHFSKINAFEDSYGRIMMSYSSNDSKKVLMPVDDATLFVNENDAKILSNIVFGKVDTVIVPIYITRLQATGGLISVGSIVDIYSLSSNGTDYYSEEDNEDNMDSSQNESSQNSSVGDESLDSEDSNSSNSNVLDDSGEFSSNLGNSQDSKTVAEEPDVSGATILAILRSKDSGVIDSSFSKSTNLIKGNNTYPTEDSSSFSTDAEELLKSSIFNGHDNGELSSYLNNYGIKLSNYERLSNIGELDTEYLVLLEIPRSDVDFVINNMDNLILTIPTEYAPNWAVNELNETYYKELNSK